MLQDVFFDDDACLVARLLLGKVIRVRVERSDGTKGAKWAGYSGWLSVAITETEAYYLHDKASHASLGYTQKRRALFMSPGTIYMYYARGGSSMNVSCRGLGNAVLIKAGRPFEDGFASPGMIRWMQQCNPVKGSGALRDEAKLCAGQTLLCRALGLEVGTWDQKTFQSSCFYIDDVGYVPRKIIQTTRLGIPAGRDAHLPYRFVDFQYAGTCTSNPLRKKRPDYTIVE